MQFMNWLKSGGVSILDQKLSYRWQTARRICANAMVCGWPPQTRPSPYVLPCWLRSFCVKGCGHKYWRTPKLGSSWWNSTLMEWEACRLIPKYTPLPHVCYPSEFGTSVIKEIRLKKMTPGAAFQGHSRSWIDPPPMTSYSNSVATTGLAR